MNHKHCPWSIDVDNPEGGSEFASAQAGERERGDGRLGVGEGKKDEDDMRWRWEIIIEQMAKVDRFRHKFTENHICKKENKNKKKKEKLKKKLKNYRMDEKCSEVIKIVWQYFEHKFSENHI